MHPSLVSMDKNKMFFVLKPEDIRAKVRIANHHPVDAGTIWERSIPDPQIVCIMEGLFTYQEKNEAGLNLQPGDILFIEPNRPHRFFITACSGERCLEASGSSLGSIAGMHLEFTQAGAWAAGDYRLAVTPRRVTRTDDPAYLNERFKYLAAVYESYQPFRLELVNTIATEIVLTLAAYWGDEVERSVRPSQRMETILAYIREHLAEPLTRQSLAETFNLSAGHINYLFKVELGMSPSAVINRERAARAYQLMDREGMSVTEAAAAVGFHDPFYFSRVFKQIYSIPPSEIATKR